MGKFQNYSVNKTFVVEWIRRRPSNAGFSSSRPTAGKNLTYFLLRFHDRIIHQKIPQLFPRQVDKTTTQQPKVQQLESTGYQERQAAATAETSGIQYDNVGGEVKRKEVEVGVG